MDELTRQTLEATRAALAKTVASGIVTGTGLLGYSLENPSRLLYPVPTPLRNSIARVGPQTGITGTAEHWKIITGINSNNLGSGVGEGHRSGAIALAEADKVAPYATLGLENFVSFEAESASQGFEDVRATAALVNLQALMLSEENIILNGNFGTGLGTTPTPTGVPAAGSGTIGSQATNKVGVVALTQDGYLNSSVSPTGVPDTITRTNADATTDTWGAGHAIPSALSSAITTTGGNQYITASVAAVPGAVAYAWYLCTDGAAAHAYLAAITTVNTVTLTAAASSANQAFSTVDAADHSKNGLVFDGLIASYLNNSGYFASLDGGTLTADNVGGIVQIDTALKAFWDSFRMSPTTMWMGAQVKKDFNTKMLTTTGGLPGYRMNITAADARGLQGVFVVASYLNKFGMGDSELVDVKLHPNMPPGMILFDTDKTPPLYMNSRLPTPRRIRTRREYYQIDWPLRTREYEMGVYVEEMLQVYAGFMGGVIANIGAG